MMRLCIYLYIKNRAKISNQPKSKISSSSLNNDVDESDETTENTSETAEITAGDKLPSILEIQDNRGALCSSVHSVLSHVSYHLFGRNDQRSTRDKPFSRYWDKTDYDYHTHYKSPTNCSSINHKYDDGHSGEGAIRWNLQHFVESHSFR